MKRILIILIILVVLGGIWLGLEFIIGKLKPPEPIVCTMDAKLCSDGSYVGRVPPACDFAPCPKEDLIVIESPRAYEEISSPFIIKGRARGFWFFEADFPILLLSEDGQIISQIIATAQSEWMTEEFVDFKAKLEFPTNLSGKATLIFKKDNPSGLPEHDDQLIMPVILEAKESIKIKVFFNNSQFDPEFSCVKVFPVERIIPKTQAVAKAAIEELLKGPSEEEKINGFFTSINPGVKIQKLTIEKGVAKVDFDQQLEFQVGGSCRVGAIRSQIEQTLKQFPTVKNVIISIDGRTEDVLQP